MKITTMTYSLQEFIALAAAEYDLPGHRWGVAKLVLAALAEYDADHGEIGYHSDLVHDVEHSSEHGGHKDRYGLTVYPAGSLAPVLRPADYEPDPGLEKIAAEYGYIDVAATWQEIADAAAEKLAEIERDEASASAGN